MVGMNDAPHDATTAMVGTPGLIMSSTLLLLSLRLGDKRVEQSPPSTLLIGFLD